MNLIKSHKIVTATILVGIIGSAVGIAVINQPVDNQVRHVSEMVAEKTPPKETEPINEVSTETSTESTQEILVENTPEPAPIVVERKIATPEDVALRVYQPGQIISYIAEKIRPLKYSEITILLGAQKAVTFNTVYEDELDSFIYQCIDYAESLIKELESKGQLLHRDDFICQV